MRVKYAFKLELWDDEHPPTFPALETVSHEGEVTSRDLSDGPNPWARLLGTAVVNALHLVISQMVERIQRRSEWKDPTS